MVVNITRDSPDEQLSPDEIRRIREGLRLTQVEAGELLGGGPRAFTKYEGGIIAPSAAIANLLRLLDAQPTGLSVLTGRKSVAIEADS
jgi:putative zinc finger/helix-turn-helix YgiT family protein